MNHDRRFCIDCGGKLNSHEWFYGACSECIKKRAKANRWRPTGHDGRDITGWFYALNAPRMSEYVDYHDLDDNGVIALMEVLFGHRHHWARKGPDERPAPPAGTKRCRKCHRLIPEEGPATCAICLEKHNAYMDARRQQRIENHECTACGAKLPAEWTHKCCNKCLSKYKTYNYYSRLKQEART